MISFAITVQRPTLLIQAEGVLDTGITTLTGSSGSGKSTIIKSLAGLVRPTTGRIVREDKVWVDTTKNIFLAPQQRFVGYMPQGNIVFPHMSVYHNITYSKRGDEALLSHIMNRLGLHKYKDIKAGTLSGGEQQRVALGRALYAKPVILLLDEPLSALDWNLREQVRRDLVDIIGEWQIPCLWVTHDKNEADKVGQQRWHCEAGQLYTE